MIELLNELIRDKNLTPEEIDAIRREVDKFRMKRA